MDPTGCFLDTALAEADPCQRQAPARQRAACAHARARAGGRLSEPVTAGPGSTPGSGLARSPRRALAAQWRAATCPAAAATAQRPGARLCGPLGLSARHPPRLGARAIRIDHPQAQVRANLAPLSGSGMPQRACSGSRAIRVGAPGRGGTEGARAAGGRRTLFFLFRWRSKTNGTPPARNWTCHAVVVSRSAIQSGMPLSVPHRISHAVPSRSGC